MLRLSPWRRCFFAPKPPPSPADLLAFALSKSHGVGVYTHFDDAFAVLKAVQDTKPAWWTEECSTFIKLAGLNPTGLVLRDAQRDPTKSLAPVIVVEGLDGVGKSTTTAALAERLGAKLIQTPRPTLDSIRGLFRVLEDPLARAFYSLANYEAAGLIGEHVLFASSPVVVDRWWPSTAAMALANQTDTVPSLTDVPEAATAWPSDLPQPTLGVLLDVSEEIRLKRMARRGDANIEEQRLAADRAARTRATEAYLKLGPRPLTVVQTPTYMSAVNDVIDMLLADQVGGHRKQSGDSGAAAIILPDDLASRKFSAADMAQCRPY